MPALNCDVKGPCCSGLAYTTSFYSLIRMVNDVSAVGGGVILLLEESCLLYFSL